MKIDIAAALIALKTRHRLSAKCIDDVCSLLNVLKVNDAPTSWFSVKNAFNRSYVAPLSRNCWSICPKCFRPSKTPLACDDSSCQWSFTPPQNVPKTFYTFNILDQLSSILATTNSLNIPARDRHGNRSISIVQDLVDGEYYQHIRNNEDGEYITLTISIDGVQPYDRSEKSIWPLTLVINEIKRKERFRFENLILGGVWPGPKKPKREEMFAFLDTIVQQLKPLEEGQYFECRSDSDIERRRLEVFLICACMDKPAQSLVQNIAEPIAKYGCGRCEIRGENSRSC